MEEKAYELGQEIFIVNFLTPDYFSENIPAEELDSNYKKYRDILVKIPYYDWTYQMQALLDQDIYQTTNHSLNEAKKRIKADIMIIVNQQDHIVNPRPSIEFAKSLNTQLMILNSNCGHNAFGCEQEKISKRIIDFLNN